MKMQETIVCEPQARYLTDKSMELFKDSLTSLYDIDTIRNMDSESLGLIKDSYDLLEKAMDFSIQMVRQMDQMNTRLEQLQLEVLALEEELKKPR